ncbi:MAG TPA: ABC transporter permease [Candidatus Eisenbacteria bacterium]
MKLSRLTRVALSSILKNKMRAILTMLGVIIGVAAVIVMVAVGQGAQSQIRQQIQNLGTNLIVVTPGTSNKGGVNQGAQTFNRLTVADAEAMKKSSTLLTGVSPVILTRSQVVGGAGNWRTFIYGVAPDYQTIRGWPVSDGRFFDDNDLRAIRKVAVVGKTVADNLFPDQSPVGQQVRIRDVPFEIIGMLSPKGQTAEGSDMDDVILSPYTTIQTRLSGHQFIAQILGSTASPGDIPYAQDEITGILRGTHRLSDAEDPDFTVRNQTDIANAAEETTRVMTLLLAAIASISLLVGGIGIMNIMLVSVTERTREIGIRMAIGARGSDVLTQFLVESIVLSLLGGLVGVAVGFAGSSVLGRVMGWRTLIVPETVVIALVFSAGVGIFFGFYPARKAASLQPIEALRYE